MNDPQNLGLGELGQRVRAMSDPAGDSRLRPYQGAPAANGHSGPSFEGYEETRTTRQAEDHPSQTAYTRPPFQPTGPVSAAGHEPVSPWETVPLRADSTPPAAATQQAALPSGSPPAARAASEAPRSGLHRALDAIRSTLPMVQKLLPMIDGNFATAVGALMAPHAHPSSPPPPQVVHIDMEPIERGLEEVRNSHRELRGQVLEQVTSLKRVEDQLERVREATDRNTLEQQELAEELRSVRTRVSTFAILGLLLLLASLGLNIYLIVQLQHLLR